MKWFKHESNFRNHEDVASFLDVGTGKQRFERYGLLISIFEAVSEQVDWEGEPALTLPLRGWARVLGCHQNLLRAYLGNPEIGVGHLRDCPMIQVTFVRDRYQIRIEYLRTCLDETTRKEGKKRDSTPPGNSGATPAREEEEEDENRSDRISSSRREHFTTTPAANQLDDGAIDERVRTLVYDWNEMSGKTGLQTVDQCLLPPETLACARERVCEKYWWEIHKEALNRVANTPFLVNGDPTRERYRNFRASFDFFVQPDTILKILSEKYGKPNLEGQDFDDSIGF